MSHLSRALLRRLPDAIRSRVSHRFRARAYYSQVGPRNDIRSVARFPIDSDLVVDVYWLRFKDEEGPAASVFWHDTEIMRIDMLSREPHVHYRFYGSAGQVRGSRVAVQPAATEVLIDRLEHELATNVVFALHVDPRPELNQHHLDPALIARAAGDAARHLRAEAVARSSR